MLLKQYSPRYVENIFHSPDFCLADGATVVRHQEVIHSLRETQLLTCSSSHSINVADLVDQ